MQATTQPTAYVPHVGVIGNTLRHRLSKTEIASSFVDVDDSRRSVLKMVECFYNRPYRVEEDLDGETYVAVYDAVHSYLYHN